MPDIRSPGEPSRDEVAAAWRARSAGEPRKARPGPTVAVTLLERAEATGALDLLVASWVDAANVLRDLNPAEVGVGSDCKATWRCQNCGCEFERVIHLWSPARCWCGTCGHRQAARNRRAAIEPAHPRWGRLGAIMAAQWDFERNDAAGLSPREVTPADKVTVAWRCAACGHRWHATAHSRYSSIQTRLKSVAAKRTVDQDDGAFACAHCGSAHKVSHAELLLAVELRHFFSDLRSGFVDDYWVQLGESGSVYTPDMAIPSRRLFIEYDGHRYHHQRATLDESRTLDIERSSQWSVLRVRERAPDRTPQPAIATWCVHVNMDDPVPVKTCAVLSALEVAGILPDRGIRPNLARYLRNPTWVTEAEARELIRRLGRDRPTTAGALKRLGIDGILTLYDEGGSWSDFASKLGVEPSSVAEVIRSLFGVNPTKFLRDHGRTPFMPPGRKRVTATGTHDDLVGTLADAEVAKIIGCSTGAVRTRRLRLGRPSQRQPSPILPFAGLLGKVPDTRIAKLAGVSTTAVHAFRTRRGVPPCPRRRMTDDEVATIWAAAASADT